MKKKRFKLWQILLIALNVLLVLCLCGVLLLEKRREAKTERIAEKAVQSIESAREAAASSAAEAAAGQEMKEETAAEEMRYISLRGDSYEIPGEDGTTTIAALLQKRLDDRGLHYKVLDYMLDSRSALTNLYYAGVPEDVINEYIRKNKASDRVDPSDERETSIGDVSDLETARTDLDAMPIIFLGNNGGWGKDPYELIDMVSQILTTYNEREKYFVIGNHFDGYEDISSIDAIMSGHWGTHFVGIPKIGQTDLRTKRGHEQVADAIIKRMQQSGVIPADAA